MRSSLRGLRLCFFTNRRLRKVASPTSPNTKIFKATRKDEQLVYFSIKLNPRTSVVYLFTVGENGVGAGLRAHLLIGVAA